MLFAPNPAFCQPMLAPVGTKLRPRPHYGTGSLRNIRDVLLALRMRLPSCRQSQSGPECRPVSRAGAARNCGPSTYLIIRVTKKIEPTPFETRQTKVGKH